jgi:predicted nucleotidyltransferase component of viral defense system
MEDFARLPAEERRLYFEQAAAQLGMSAQIVEKDFWVCWILRRLFLLDEFRDHLTFKGGTTLSKVYRVIERFSEDVDVAIERGFLGFDGENEPEKAKAGKNNAAE